MRVKEKKYYCGPATTIKCVLVSLNILTNQASSSYHEKKNGLG